MINRNNNKDLFIIKSIKTNKEYKYAINCIEKDYITIQYDSYIANLILPMEIGDITDIYNEDFILIYRNNSLDNKINNNINLLLSYDNEYLKEKLIFELKKYNSLGFFHETSIENLYSIYKEQYIYSRNKIMSKNIPIKSIANIEVLKLTDEFYYDCARFYLRSNTPANYKFQGHTCILVCDYDIIKSNNEMYITDKIATRRPLLNDLSNNDDISYILNNFKYNKIYETEYIDTIETDCQYKYAEFLCKDKLPIKYIKTIILKDEIDKIWFKNTFPNWDINIIVNRKYFKKSLYIKENTLYDKICK